jgi:hypothetical protein
MGGVETLVGAQQSPQRAFQGEVLLRDSSVYFWP